MNSNGESFPLTVTVPADQWDFINRRQRYLEAVIVQVLRDSLRVKEWFTAAELAAFRLQGLPGTRGSITRVATARGWQRRRRDGRGDTAYEYHFINLLGRAFDDLISRIVAVPDLDDDDADAPPVPQVKPAPLPPAGAPANASPSWLLPLMRLIRTSMHRPTVRQAVSDLAGQLPPGTPCPSVEEAHRELAKIGFTFRE